MHMVIKSGSCSGQGAGKCSGRAQEGGDTEMAGKCCSRQEGDAAKYQYLETLICCQVVSVADCGYRQLLLCGHDNHHLMAICTI